MPYQQQQGCRLTRLQADSVLTNRAALSFCICLPGAGFSHKASTTSQRLATDLCCVQPLWQWLQVLKSDGRAWTSKYARGGSARKNSARSLYIVVDALQGHITSNG